MSEETPSHENLRSEVAREFQVERVILFSDAVFAIVITLVAIEIRMPELDEHVSFAVWLQHLRKLLPSLAAYAFSFVIIGNIWYRHLKLFGYVKSYDAGLIIRNLQVLFLVGLFPFSISLITSGKVFYPTYFIYIFLVVASSASQLILTRYVLVKRPWLCNSLSRHNARIDLRISGGMFGVMCAAVVLVLGTYFLIPDEKLKPFAYWWMMTLPFFSVYFRRKYKDKRIPEP